MNPLKKITLVLNAISKHPLAGKHRLKAYWRFFHWQMLQLIYPKQRKVPFVGDTFLLVNKGMTGATGNIYCGLHEFEDMSFLLHFLREEDTFIDVGANIGSYTILASGVSKATTVSIEPVPTTFHYLKENVAVNRIEDRTQLWNAAAGATVSTLKFTSTFDTVNHALSKEEEKNTAYIEVKSFPLSDMVNDDNSVKLIKIDAEGFETEVLKGMNLLLTQQSLKAIIIELNGSGGRYGYDENDIHEKLKANNFTPYSYEPFTRKLTELYQFSNKNTIYISDITFVQERISTAKEIAVFSEKF